MSDTDTPSNDIQDYGVQPPAVPDDSADSTNSDERRPTSVPAESSTIDDSHLPMINDIIGKIDEANNILIALSTDPSVDELATAIALSLSLDRLKKRVTAIYSGETPNALSFLKPEETFEAQPDTLQDFVIALNKDKADHLRYKIDGDYVKIFITPYRSRISEEDLEFSYGDFNVDLVIALDVANGVDLDDALREHGRIMHDATIVNITTAKPGKLGEIEWSDTKASSVSEMVAELLLTIGKLEKPEATALLTGIIAATDRFANSHTTSHSLEIASQLISAGANQQLIAKNIASELDGTNSSISKISSHKDKGSIADSIREKAIAKDNAEDDPMSLDIRHHDEPAEEPEIPSYKEVLGESEDSPTNPDSSLSEDDKNEDEEDAKPDEKDTISSDEVDEEKEDEALTDDLEAAEATLSTAGAEVVPEAERKPLNLGVDSTPKKEEPSAAPEDKSENEADDGIVGPFGSDDDEEDNASEDNMPTDNFLNSKSEKIIAPPSPSSTDQQPTTSPALVNPATSPIPTNPATSSTPDVASTPEANNIPDMNYMPMPSDEILPPPPTPPVDFSAAGAPPINPIIPSAVPPASPNPFLNSAPAQNANPFMASPSMPNPSPNPFASPSAMPGNNAQPPVANPGSFQIPGM